MPLTDVKNQESQAKQETLQNGGQRRLVFVGKAQWRQTLAAKYRFMGNEQLLSHGQYPDVSLAQARQKCDEARAILAEGNDPGVQKKLDQLAAATQTRTNYKLFAEEYLEVLMDRDLAPATIVKNRWLLLKCLSPAELCHYLGVPGGMSDGSEAVFG